MRKPTAAQLALLMASVATAAETTCAIDCFQGLITNGPPADCKEATNYLCFCTMPTLQENFSKCADTTCGKDTGAAMTWANDLCAKLGKPVDLGPGEGAPKTDATTAVEAPVTTADEARPTTEAEKTTAADAEKTDSKAEETPAETSVPSETSEETSETCTTETTLTKTETTFAKATATDEIAVTTDEDGSVGTITGSAETATASSEVDISAGSITTPGFLVAAGVVAALWQFI
ncbi:hypothetical protein FLONG3_6601 [Fusarium longipes]|uniref:CFEM domain-containing protein n=1 Tax=Fusarium longipes TaxID=694270 RepID=A0A395SJG9_9HYPO|nr:hypothetical protein FLONG3_6601 [Fusarium longipes]